MDKVEQYVEANVPTDAAYRKAVERSILYWWNQLFGASPAYIKFIEFNTGISHDKVVVEADGLRICAFKDHATWGWPINPWDIAESFIFRYTTMSYTDLSASSAQPWLKRRRRRLQRRGLYNG